MAKINIIIFDGDGTIFDSMPSCINAFSGILEKRYDIPRGESESYLVSRIGAPLNLIFYEILQKRGKPTDSIDVLVNEFHELMEFDVPIFDDVKPALERLSAYKRFISTNLRQNILDARVRYHKLENHLNGYFGLNGFKNKETHVNAIISSYGLSGSDLKDSIVLVGDGPGDMELARKFGIIGIGRIGTTDADTLKKAGASYTINTLLETENVLGQL